MYSFTLQPPGKHLETTGADDQTLLLLPSASEGDNQSVRSSAPVVSMWLQCKTVHFQG